MATITHKQGDTLELTFELKTGTTAVDITNYTISSQLRDSTDTLLTTDNFNGSLTYSAIDASAGQFQLSASSTATAEWPEREYNCDVQFIDNDSETSSSETFKIKVIKDVTRA